jgi:hypothetical protein
MRAILTSAYGVRCDISTMVETLVAYGRYEDFRDVAVSRYIAELGCKLVLVGGRMGPMAVFVALEEHMKPEYAAHVAELWGLDEIDDDDVPTLALAGPPPTGRLRAAAG